MVLENNYEQYIKVKKCLLVVDDNEKLLGTLTDGDLRRSILAGENISGDIYSSYNSDPTVLIKEKYTIEEAEHYLRNLNLVLIPVVDEKMMYDKQPNYALLLSWHIADELIPILKNKGYKGNFIVPLPEPIVMH